VTSAIRLTLGLAAAATAAGLGAWVIARYRYRRRKSPEEIERQRRLDVNRRGRIAVGRVVDLVEPASAAAPGRLVLYTYEVASVTYEAAQDISALPSLAATAHQLAGQTVSVKYEPQRPANSIIACEEWSGISLNDGARDSGLGAGEEPELVPPRAPNT
jgi:hypothetical protein